MGKQNQKDDVVWNEINGQTARIEWSELEQHFARGVVVWLAPDQDLVDIAVQLARDKAGNIEPLTEEGKIARMLDDQARDWSERNPVLWAVVVAPWILVQEKI